jgi:hypothetical protein
VGGRGKRENQTIAAVIQIVLQLFKVFAVPVQTQKPPPLMSMMQNLFGGMKKA